MDIKINLGDYLENDKLKMDSKKFQKMILMFNAIENGWTLKKRNDSYVFTKNHEGKKAVFQDEYLLDFFKDNMCVTNIFI